ncbi:MULTISPECIES: ribonuclease III [unclassified Dehalobacter]|uniref:ribonuclease III n=1 Tax=unclassified Dehalobacter TaxID=2635733 RepID=UPI000E6BB2A8|nr:MULTISPECIES: ribonuclease III [unclassified Dehalobacter]RJE49209.1 ribonuclease III [Dehalobacter sp. MCB1]TCX53251.1 ribonuclease III [Dehalobacter sp. 14DCB1]TCX54265.1 ribonuclease III [Dehalobacter sp. 12DCB1]
MVKRNRRAYFHKSSRNKYLEQTGEVESFISQLGLENLQSELIFTAMTHPSFTFENPNSGLENNQRLEFLGDAVLDFIIGEYLYQNYPDKPEGELTKMRAAVVNETTLARKARSINLGQALFLGKGEQSSGGRDRPSIIADALEAVIGAIYLQYGFEKVRKFILDMLVPEILELNEGNYGDFKTMLQEKAQKKEYEVYYRIIEETGPDHDKRFTAGVYLHGELQGTGIGKTKKEAEQQAARFALKAWEV